MSFNFRLWIVTLTLLCAASVASAQTTIRLASPAPLGSVWHKALKQFEADVRTATAGRVVVRVIGAAQDDEATMISNMKIGRQHAASITALGLASVDPAFNIFAIPMFFSSYDEYRAVRAKLEQQLGYRPGRRQMREIKDDMITELLPRAFSRSISATVATCCACPDHYPHRSPSSTMLRRRTSG